jgi:hypothetical protein
MLEEEARNERRGERPAATVLIDGALEGQGRCGNCTRDCTSAGRKQVVLPSISTDNRAVLSACFSASAARSCGAHGSYSRRITLEDRCFEEDGCC